MACTCVVLDKKIFECEKAYSFNIISKLEIGYGVQHSSGADSCLLLLVVFGVVVVVNCLQPSTYGRWRCDLCFCNNNYQFISLWYYCPFVTVDELKQKIILSWLMTTWTQQQHCVLSKHYLSKHRNNKHATKAKCLACLEHNCFNWIKHSLCEQLRHSPFGSLAWAAEVNHCMRDMPIMMIMLSCFQDYCPVFLCLGYSSRTVLDTEQHGQVLHALINPSCPWPPSGPFRVYY